MATIENIKNSLIDRILVTKNEKLLTALNNILESTQASEVISLKLEQIEILLMSENDIQNNNLISESELNKNDSEWMS